MEGGGCEMSMGRISQHKQEAQDIIASGWEAVTSYIVKCRGRMKAEEPGYDIMSREYNERPWLHQRSGASRKTMTSHREEVADQFLERTNPWQPC